MASAEVPQVAPPRTDLKHQPVAKSPLTPPADVEHESEHDRDAVVSTDELYFAAETLTNAAAMVPSNSSPATPQTSGGDEEAHVKHGRKAGRPHRSPRERTMSTSPGVVFHMAVTAADHTDSSSFEILQYPHSKQPPLAAHVADVHPSPAEPMELGASDNEDDYYESQQEVPYLLESTDDSAPDERHPRRRREDGGSGRRARDASPAGAGSSRGTGPLKRAAPRKTHQSLSLPHPTPARSSAFYPKNPKSDRVPGGKQANTGNKKCFACGTKKTPYWRDGWDGVLLCNACGIRFTKYRLRCLNCLYVPRKDEKHFHNCVKCGATMPPPAR